MFRLTPLALALCASLALQHQQPICDHAAPPPGMHYICANQNSCDCRLVADEPRNGDEQSEYRPPVPAPDSSPCHAGNVRYFVAPDYPPLARQAGKQGTVIARLAIDPAGNIDEVKIPSGDPLLTGPVIQILKNWKFAPTGATQTASVSVTFALASHPVTKPVAATVSGSSPLNLVITTSPVMPRRAHNHERAAGNPR
jgi:TonB family protein